MSAARFTCWLTLASLSTFGCGNEWSSSNDVCHAESDSDHDDPARMLATLLDEHGSTGALAALLTTESSDEDSVLVALFPAVAGRTLVDRVLSPPAPYTGTIYDEFPPTPIAFPIDWSANPLSDISWQLWFQSLYWLDRVDLDTAAFTVVDFAENALYLQPPLAFSWGDHALALRLYAVVGFVNRYVERAGDLDRKVLHAAAVLIVAHLLALGSDGCYTEGQNHGLMEDIALLNNVPHYPALRDGERLWTLALERARRQVAVSVLPDGIHIENSPGYQFHFTGLVVQVLEAMVGGGRVADPELQTASANLIGGLVAMLQPNLTLAQFGDTSNTDMQAEMTTLVRRARDVGVDTKQVDELEWMVSRGELGQAPDQIDTVFTEGGYAVFRSGWSADAEASVTAHFRAKHASHSHYHPDDTGIEIYGYGSELVLGPGVHGYDPADPFVAYQYSPAAHNVLVVDGIAAVDRSADAASRLTASYTGGDLAWVQGTHRNYRPLGIQSLVRTFAYDKLASFTVIDHVRADGKSHRYEQHFHLHPRLSAVTRSGTSLIARTVDGNGPTVTFTPATPAELHDERGVNDGGRLAGWHFPDKYQEDAATDVVVDRVDDRDELDLPVLILITAPGQPAPLPANVSYARIAGQGVLRWTIDGSERSLSAPLPDPDE